MVRLYESPGRAGACHLGPDFPVCRAEVTDLLKRRLHEGDLAFGLRPFQILTRSLRPE
ncbi:glycosyl hydrolase-related protein [Streptomyces mirabilis]|uniref:glycosyl hydrolase-related protein n=1 Tax=Streptomyces TaxID=1883 RepID=UPI0029AD20D5|nr:glycosyl hydrolase-related protein [Streptomyces sp. AK02-04a]MDX3763993.1 glycosyl hydrolase-related protein [Streptomyces sp. AK02-04a]